MTRKELAHTVDHTLLSQTAGWVQMKQLCDEALQYETASVCVPPVFVKQAAEYLRVGAQTEFDIGRGQGIRGAEFQRTGVQTERMQASSGWKPAVCTVIGFPNGYQSTAVKCFEAKEAIADGAEELDMVIRIHWAKEGRFALIGDEIKRLREVCAGKVLKVIIETCLLTEEEKIRLCEIVTEAEADFIKTSTGFSTGGATFADVSLFRKHIGEKVKIKAAGGITTLADAERFLSLGAHRLGTSRIVKLLQAEA